MFAPSYFAPTYFAPRYFPPDSGIIAPVEKNKGPYVKWWEYEQIAIREDEEIIMLLTAFAEVLKCQR